MTHSITLSALFEPEQSRPERGSKFANARLFQEWLESLPLGNMTAAGNELLAAVQELNQLRLPARTRADMLERLLEPVLTVVDVLDRHIQETSFPLDEKQDRVGRVAVRFLQEIALAYRIAAHDLAGEGTSVGFLHKKSVAHHLHASLSATLQMMLRTAMLYQPMPEGIWHEINAVYVFARQNGLIDRSMENRFIKGPATIDQIYKRMALFAVSGPERLGQRAVRALFEATAPWSEHCAIRENFTLEIPAPVFELDSRSDDPPVLVDESRLPNRMDLAFDIGPLRTALTKQQADASAAAMELSFSDPNGARLVIGRDLIGQLLACWGVRRRRSFRRVEAQHAVSLLVGLDAIHYTLAGDSTFPRFLREYGDPRFAESAGRERSTFGFPDDGTGRPIRHQAEVLNQSIGGYRLRIKDPKHLQVKVGELVAVSPQSLVSDLEMWMVGIIRWLTAIDVREIEVGIAIVARRGIPSALLDVSASEPPPNRALVLHPFELSETTSALVFPSNVKADKATSLCVGDDIEGFCGTIHFTKQLERTAEIGRYLFTPKAKQA